MITKENKSTRLGLTDNKSLNKTLGSMSLLRRSRNDN